MAENQKSGAKTKLTEELLEAFVQGVTDGHYTQSICQRFGISQSTHSHWMARGKVDQEEGKESVYLQLFMRVNEAKFQSINKAIKSWSSHFDKDWRASAEYVARKEPNLWNKKDNMTVQVDANLHIDEDTKARIENATDKQLEEMKGKLEEMQAILDE